MRTRTRLGLSAVLGALALVGATAPSGAAGDVDAAQGCVEKKNIQAIIDDSGSMGGTDFNELRRTGMELFITTPGNSARMLGATQFGSDATTVFPPAVISGNANGMIAALRAQIDANDGGTDYNAAFYQGFVDNQAADARIFLTDGGHNEDDYLEFHRNGPPTYVVGLGIGAPGTDADANRLQQIADETGGRYFPDVQQAAVQAVFNTISAIVGCQPLPRVIKMPTFVRVGQTVGRLFSPGTAPRVSFVLNWGDPDNRFAIIQILALGKNGKLLGVFGKRPGKSSVSATASKVKKLKVKRVSQPTFQSLTVKRIKGLRKLRFKVRAKKLSAAEAPLVQASKLR